MIDSSLADAIMQQVQQLEENEQVRVLEYARSLADAPAGEPGSRLIGIEGSIPAEDLEEMEQSITEGCERVDADGW